MTLENFSEITKARLRERGFMSSRAVDDPEFVSLAHKLGVPENSSPEAYDAKLAEIIALAKLRGHAAKPAAAPAPRPRSAAPSTVQLSPPPKASAADARVWADFVNANAYKELAVIYATDRPRYDALVKTRGQVSALDDSPRARAARMPVTSQPTVVRR